jgi:hypothetical protein
VKSAYKRYQACSLRIQISGQESLWRRWYFLRWSRYCSLFIEPSHRRFRKSPTLDTIFNCISIADNPEPYSTSMHLNAVFLSTPGSSKWSFSSGFPSKIFCQFRPCAQHALPIYSFQFDYPMNIRRSMKLLMMQFSAVRCQFVSGLNMPLWTVFSDIRHLLYVFLGWETKFNIIKKSDFNENCSEETS